jgi:hypothetical protein
MNLSTDIEHRATGERLAFLTLARQLATPTRLEPEPAWQRPTTFATDEGLLQGNLAGLSEDERLFRATDLATPIGVYSKAQLRDTDVLFARFTLSAAEIQEVRDARSRVSAVAAGTGGEGPPAIFSTGSDASDTAAAASSNGAGVGAGAGAGGLNHPISANTVAAAVMDTASFRKPPQQSQIDDEDDDSDGCDAIGFMFDAETARSKVHFSFPTGDSILSSSSSSGSGAGKTLDITLLCIDENPGAVQSGHYVWPAATALARHLVNAWTSNEHSDEARQANDILSSRAGIPKAIVELGAGCGLAGLTALHLGCSTVVFTDHDAGTLDLIRDNIELQDLDSANIKNVFACPLAWGEEFRSSWPSQVTAHLTDEAGGGFDLLLASDVIYDSGVVEPLLWTVRHLLAPNGKAMLCGSFRLEDGTDDQVDSICKSMGMVCVTLYDNLGDGGCRLQEITLL